MRCGVVCAGVWDMTHSSNVRQKVTFQHLLNEAVLPMVRHHHFLRTGSLKPLSPYAKFFRPSSAAQLLTSLRQQLRVVAHSAPGYRPLPIPTALNADLYKSATVSRIDHLRIDISNLCERRWIYVTFYLPIPRALRHIALRGANRA